MRHAARARATPRSERAAPRPCAGAKRKCDQPPEAIERAESRLAIVVAVCHDFETPKVGVVEVDALGPLLQKVCAAVEPGKCALMEYNTEMELYDSWPELRLAAPDAEGDADAIRAIEEQAVREIDAAASAPVTGVPRGRIVARIAYEYIA